MLILRLNIVIWLFYAQLDNLERAFERVRQMLYGRLHDLIRKQIVERVHMQTISLEKLENDRSNSCATHLVSSAWFTMKENYGESPYVKDFFRKNGKWEFQFFYALIVSNCGRERAISLNAFVISIFPTTLWPIACSLGQLPICGSLCCSYQNV